LLSFCRSKGFQSYTMFFLETPEINIRTYILGSTKCVSCGLYRTTKKLGILDNASSYAIKCKMNAAVQLCCYLGGVLSAQEMSLYTGRVQTMFL
jgi:hypothetical protein